MDLLISHRLSLIEKQINEAAARSGRLAGDITIVAVSKTVAAERIRAAISCGTLNFGENRVQELQKKMAEISEAVIWHYIGRLQTNKVRALNGKKLLIHSLDRLELLEEMKRQSKQSGWRWQALIEVNVSGEAAKAGVDSRSLLELTRAASESGCVDICGLMTVGPQSVSAEEIRSCFKKLRELSVDIQSRKMDNVDMRHLSMGMSQDFVLAVEEGATLVRLGTAIFGERD